MPTLKQVTVVGLGLIGGSIAKSLRARFPNLVLLAVDRGDVFARPYVGETINQFIESTSLDAHRSLIAQSDLVVLCQPVRIIAESIAQYVTPNCVVTDTGSTKRHIVECARRLPGSDWFVPGHPMAGREQGGFENATADLFEGRPWIVCPEGCHADAVARVESFVDGLGAQRLTMTPEQHDAAVAVVSHVPQILSSWLRVAGNRQNAVAAAGPAFRDMTRIAGGATSIWRDIFETNADEIGRVLRDGALAMSALADALAAEPPRIERVLGILEQARICKSPEACPVDSSAVRAPMPEPMKP